jgi:LemA protein
LIVVVECYPDLKASQNFMAQQVELAGTENRIAVERRRFNLAAQNYNAYILCFPKNILANRFGFKFVAYF